MKKENTDKKKFAAVTAAAVCMSLVIVITSTGVFTAISLVRNLKTIDNYQSSLEEATALECEIKDLYRQISDSTDNLAESVKNLDLSQSLSEIEKLKGIFDELPDKIENLSEISGNDYSFLLDMLPHEKLKTQLNDIAAENWWELLGSENLLKTLGYIFSENKFDTLKSDVKEALERLAALDLTGTLKQNIEAVKIKVLTCVLLLSTETIFVVGLSFAAVIILKKGSR